MKVHAAGTPTFVSPQKRTVFHLFVVERFGARLGMMNKTSPKFRPVLGHKIFNFL